MLTHFFNSKVYVNFNPTIVKFYRTMLKSPLMFFGYLIYVFLQSSLSSYSDVFIVTSCFLSSCSPFLPVLSILYMSFLNCCTVIVQKRSVVNEIYIYIIWGTSFPCLSNRLTFCCFDSFCGRLIYDKCFLNV